MMVTEKENVAILREAPHTGFDRQLANTTFIAERLGKLKLKEHQYYTWPIYSGILTVLEGKDWIAIGDAASSYDTVAAHGIYKGISDGIAASEKIITFFNGGTGAISYSDFIRNRYANYKKNRANVYALEQRWYNSPFWKKRIINP